MASDAALSPAIAPARAFLASLYESAVARATDMSHLIRALPAPPNGRTIVIGAGKAAATMALAVDFAWQAPLEGLVVTRYGHGLDCGRIEVVEAGHPLPDGQGAEAAARILALAANAGEDDLVIALISGGGSALLAQPAPGLSMDDKRATTARLLSSGASIAEINTVRKHMSAIKGGQLAAAAWPARVVTFAISDVPGDDPAIIASGPTLPDPTTLADAVRVLRRYAVPAPANMTETPKADDPRLARTSVELVATPASALAAAAHRARRAGIRPIVLGDDIEGDAEEVGRDHARQAQDAARAGQPVLLISGGETTVRVTRGGRGGRNAHYLLALLNALGDAHDVVAIAADTDGLDGSEDNAGALMDPTSLARARALGLDSARALKACDSYGFFSSLGDLHVTGPTRTNVNDFRAILVNASRAFGAQQAAQ